MGIAPAAVRRRASGSETSSSTRGSRSEARALTEPAVAEGAAAADAALAAIVGGAEALLLRGRATPLLTLGAARRPFPFGETDAFR
jgi:hypothetical protein